ncbi:ecotin, putative [Leishmania donovani]|uniref:Ecotin, putative n=1 Tax=Leishmania donovani TaxID=5661 RepID=E9BC77_LEIDO|nr:ecotin, putative [Leishmania donovani]CBZ32853.1 ecotin, putative [Leishmania donovani]
MSTRRGTTAAAHAPVQPSLRALDEHVQMLRAEARTGLGSRDVRRALIKEELRPPRVVCGGGGARGPKAPSLTTGSAASGSVTASAGADGGIADIPSAWLEGDFHLKSAVADGGGAAAAFRPACVRFAGEETATMSTGAAPLPPDSSNALRTYQALCAAADEVDYDVSYEEALRQVEDRDSQTGLATTWRTRRRPSAPLPFSSMAVTASALSWDARGERSTCAGGVEAAGNLRSAASHELYTKPPSRPSAAGRGTAGRLFAALSASRPALQASVISAATSSAITTTRRMKAQVSRSCGGGGGGGAFSSLSTEGTAVARSSAATYAMALRQRVQEQREYASRVGGGPPRSSSTPAVWRGREDNEGSGRAAALEWRTRMTAAVTVAVCPSCAAWFERALQQPQRPLPSEEARQQTAGESDYAPRCCCPRCGHDVDTAAGADTPAGAGPRWVWAPSAATGLSEAIKRDLDGTPARVIDSAVARCPQQPSSPASAARHRITNGAGSETCGTDSVGFAESGNGGEEESFAALVARIRASKRRAQEDAEGGNATATSVSEARARQAPLSSASIAPLHPSTELAPATAPKGVGISRVCIETGMSGETMSFPPAAPLSGPPSLSELTLPARVNPFAQRLRVALNRLYFYDLWASAIGEQT